MERTRHPSGTIRRRKDIVKTPWQAIVKYPDGTTGWKTQSKTFARKGEAQAWLDRTLAEARATPGHRRPTDQTFGDFMTRWLDTVAPQLEDTTASDYRLQAHKAIAALGERPLVSLTALDFQALYTDLGQSGLSSRSVRYVHAVCHRAMVDAVAWRVLPLNPVIGAKPPKANPRIIQPPTPAQSEQFLSAAKDHRLKALWYFLVSSGCRRGEALGLQWDDIDWSHRRAQIRREIVKVEGHASVHEYTKTSHGQRAVPLSQWVVDQLRDHQARQELERQAAGDAWKEGGWVFTTQATGQFIRPDSAYHAFKRLLERAGLPATIRVHDLRHAMASFWLGEGVPVGVVTERLGHADSSITHRIYSHVIPNAQASVVDAMDAAVFKSVTFPSPREEKTPDNPGEPE